MKAHSGEGWVELGRMRQTKSPGSACWLARSALLPQTTNQQRRFRIHTSVHHKHRQISIFELLEKKKLSRVLTYMPGPPPSSWHLTHNCSLHGAAQLGSEAVTTPRPNAASLSICVKPWELPLPAHPRDRQSVVSASPSEHLFTQVTDSEQIDSMVG